MFYFKRKYWKVSIFVATIVVVFAVGCNVFAIKPYYKLDFTTGIVTGNNLNVRSGPSTAYGVVTKLQKNEYIRVFARSR